MDEKKIEETAEPEEEETSGARSPTGTDPGGGTKSGRGGEPVASKEDFVSGEDDTGGDDTEGVSWRCPPGDLAGTLPWGE